MLSAKSVRGLEEVRVRRLMTCASHAGDDTKKIRWMGNANLLPGFWSENLKERDCLEGLGVDGKIILKRILKSSAVKTWTNLICLRMWRVLMKRIINIQVL